MDIYQVMTEVEYRRTEMLRAAGRRRLARALHGGRDRGTSRTSRRDRRGPVSR